jgi:hypothetical protein
MNEMLQKKVAKNYQSGQALLEYVLILAISVALVLGLMNQLYKPFGSWLQNYMGAYLECLIDIGELPSLGYDGGSGECNNRFDRGTLTAGRPPKTGLGPSNSSAKSKGASNSQDSVAGSGSSVASRRSTADSRGFAVGGSGGADGPSSGANSGTLTEKLPNSSYFRLKSSPYLVSGSQGQPRNTGISDLITVEQQKIKKRGQKAFTAIRSEEGDENLQRGKKLIVKKSERKAASDDESPSWSFSQYLKYALIFAIIIAIILFLAGQILQISKGMEK